METTVSGNHQLPNATEVKTEEIATLNMLKGGVRHTSVSLTKEMGQTVPSRSSSQSMKMSAFQ